MEKRVAVQADFSDALYIERAGLQSAAVWCQTTVLHRGATVVRSTAPNCSSNCGFGAQTKERSKSKLIIRRCS